MILITGASGLLGSHLTRELVKQGKQVRALYRTVIPGNTDNGVEWIKADILDTLSLENAMRDVQEVYHCAALVSFQPGQKNNLYTTNIRGTANVVNTCLSAGVKKLLFVSSVAALGKEEEDREINEKMKWTEKKINSDYGKSKYLAEMEVWRGIGEGLEAVIINPATILGSGDWEKGSSEIFRAAYQEIPWYTSGVNGFVDVLDVVRVMQLLMNGTPSNERFIVSAVNLSFKEILTEIAVSFGKTPPSKEVSPLLAGLLWRWEAIKTKFTHKEALLTKDSVRTAMTKAYYDNSKLKFYAPNFEYTPVKETIKRICNELTRKYHL
jgi:nucleoside-diphosphate-sugar epimerase